MQEHLKQWNYPSTRLWTIDILQRNAFVCSIQNNRETHGYVWLTPLPDSYRVMEMHILIQPTYQKRWFNRSLINQLYQVVRLLDGRHIFIIHKNKRFTQMLERLGWTRIHPFAYRRI